MNKVSILYKDRKNEINIFYNKYRDIDIDNIQDINDKIVDIHLKKENFEHPLEEFYNIVSMCSYMIDNDLYDEYYFNTFEEILEDYNKGSLDEFFLDINNDKKEIEEDIHKINEYLSLENDKMNYYDSLSEVYTKEVNKQ